MGNLTSRNVWSENAMVENQNEPNEAKLIDENPVRDRIKQKTSTDFSSSSFRRIALTQLGRINK